MRPVYGRTETKPKKHVVCQPSNVFSFVSYLNKLPFEFFRWCEHLTAR